MKRLTTKDSIMGRKHDIMRGCASVWKTKLKNYRYELIEDVVDKLGELEDILEKYDINSAEELEHIIINNGVGEQAFKEYVEVYVKPYKDIEEELGIDLMTLAKGMKNGIYVKQGKKILKKELKDIRYSKSITVHYELNGKQYDKTGAIMILYGDYNSQYCDFNNVYTYGRDWALTKEELE